GVRARAARVRRRLTWAVSGLLGFAGMASAQSAVTGTTTPRAMVSLVDESTGSTIMTFADERGAYRFLDVASGTYKIEIESQGRSRTMSRSVRVSPGLQVGLVLAVPMVIMG